MHEERDFHGKEKYDLIIIGAGPSGIFMAYELIKLGSKKVY